jgi:uncharacterized membrane protein YobD (UPF0266 family)
MMMLTESSVIVHNILSLYYTLYKTMLIHLLTPKYLKTTLVIIPRRGNWEGDIFLVLSIRHSVCPSEFRYFSATTETLWEPLIPTEDVHIVVLFRSDTLTQELWPMISYAVCI